MSEVMKRNIGIGISDEAFERGSLPMTKSEVRAVILSRLCLQVDEIVYDIGSGTGSVSVEMGGQVSAGCVYAVEQKAEGIGLVTRNAERFGLSNIHPIEGRAPEALLALPAPDAAFIGGSEGSLRGILALLLEKNPKVRVVLTAVTMETVAEGTALMEEYGMEPELVLLQVSRGRRIGTRHMMTALNPIYVISGKRV